MDLGANSFQTFFYVILPNLGTAILAGGMLILSFIILLTLFYFNKRTVVRVK